MNTIATSIIFLPLIAGVINGLFCNSISKRHAGLVASFFMILSAIFAGYIFYFVGVKGEILHITITKWLSIGGADINWAIYVDQLTSIMFVVVTFVSSMVHVYSLGYMHDDNHLPKFLSFLSFFTFFMLSLVSADNFLQLFFGWEGVGLCSYLLIGYWYYKESANAAAIKAFIVNRVGDCAFILGVIMIIIYTGKADFASIFPLAESLSHETISILGWQFNVLNAICLLLFIGCMGKSAQLGLHVWLPDAMEGPTPVSALIHAATMVTSGVFLVARCSYLFEYAPVILQFIAIVGAVTCLVAATIAIAQNDIKKIIAYSTCSQLGYMFLACGVSAYQAAMFHLATHGFFKALLFLSAGSVIHAVHEQDVFKMGGLRAKMPWTYANFWIGSLAIIGIFPLAGYYSKDLILEHAYANGQLGQWVFGIGIIAAIFTAAYSMKIIMLTFHGTTRLPKDVFEKAHEAPCVMNVPLLLLILGSIFSGIIGHYFLPIDEPDGYFAGSLFFIKTSEVHDLNYLVKLLPLFVGLLGIFVGITAYRGKLYEIIARRLSLINNILKNKYYFDELYYCLIIKPLGCFSKLCNCFDSKVIDLGPNGAAQVTRGFASVASAIHTGYIYNYAVYIILAVVAVMTYVVISW